jgi:hypothetical protein
VCSKKSLFYFFIAGMLLLNGRETMVDFVCKNSCKQNYFPAQNFQSPTIKASEPGDKLKTLDDSNVDILSLFKPGDFINKKSTKTETSSNFSFSI